MSRNSEGVTRTHSRTYNPDYREQRRSCAKPPAINDQRSFYGRRQLQPNRRIPFRRISDETVFIKQTTSSTTSTKTNPKAEPWRRGRSNFILTRFLFLFRSFAGCTTTTTTTRRVSTVHSGFSGHLAPYDGVYTRFVRVYLWRGALLETNTVERAWSNQQQQLPRSSRT